MYHSSHLKRELVPACPASIGSEKFAAFVRSALCLFHARSLQEIPGNCNYHDWVISAFVGVAELCITLLAVNPFTSSCVRKLEMHLTALVFSCLKEFEVEQIRRWFTGLRNWLRIFTSCVRNHEVTVRFFLWFIIIVSKWSLFVNVRVVLLEDGNANEVVRSEEFIHPV